MRMNSKNRDKSHAFLLDQKDFMMVDLNIKS